MVDPRLALDDGFSLWLKEIAGGRYVRQGTPLDPYRSSFRNSGRAMPWLRRIEEGQAPATSDPGQNVSDLKNALLVEGGRGVDSVLTPLGAAVLAAWREHGVGNERDLDEVARAALLLRCALNLELPLYVRMYDFWEEVRLLRPATEWFQDVPGAYLASYLNSTSSIGFNPFRVLTALGYAFDGGLAPWKAWANEADSSNELKKFVRTVTDSATRPGGRRGFCQAIEAVWLARAGTENLPEIVEEWGISG